MHRLIASVAIVCAGALLVPATARAQASISGLVQDTTGAVLPGVMVEASSPALIEKVRSGVTDAAGRYAIINLRPGTYAVTFTLAGFTTVRREGLVLEGAFTAQVNAELRVGALAETVTVSGQTSVVDVQSTRQQTVINRELLDVLPTSRDYRARADLVPGIIVTGGNTGPSSHGSETGEGYMFNDGMHVAVIMAGTGVARSGPELNDAAVEEMTYDTGAQSAEFQVSGIRMNAIPKEGGNLFSGTTFVYGAGGGVQSDNRTPELLAVIKDANRLAYNYEFNPAFGGPIRHDTLWFFGALKYGFSKTYYADTYFPDGQQGSTGNTPQYHVVARLTYQMTPRNKIRLNFEKGKITVPYSFGGNGIAQESNVINHLPGRLAQLKWTSPVTNRLLFEVMAADWNSPFRHLFESTVGPFDVAHIELTTGATTVAAPGRHEYQSHRFMAVASVSYVTGSHTFKAGMSHESGSQHWSQPYHGDIQSLRFLNGQPNVVNVTNTPNAQVDELHADRGLYVQDAWILHRFTFNLGARYDHFNAGIPAASAPAGNFVPAREFPALPNVPSWNDWAVRLGVSYDLFGNGKTAFKVNAGKYLAGQALGFTSPLNPMAVQQDQRSWGDLDGNGSVLDANGNVQYAEIGPSRNANFGLLGGAAHADPNIPRGYNWEQSVVIQHELRPGVSVSAGYYGRQFHNLQWTDNLAVDPSRDYTPFTITTPTDPRLPGGGGEVITLYNLNPAKLGQVVNVIKASTTNRKVYNGFEMTANVRLRRDAFVFGGLTMERTAFNSCQVSNPNALRFCESVTPFRPNFKVAGTYRLPYGLQLSGSLRVNPGVDAAAGALTPDTVSIGALYNVSSAIAGVPLTGGGTLSVRLIEPNTRFYDYRQQLDLRLLRTFQIGRVRPRVILDIYNVLNVSTVTLINKNYGANWLRPQQIVQGRYLRFGTQIDF